MAGTVARKAVRFDLVRSLGTDRVIVDTLEDFTRGGHQYDPILDIPDKQPVTDRTRALTRTAPQAHGRG